MNHIHEMSLLELLDLVGNQDPDAINELSERMNQQMPMFFADYKPTGISGRSDLVQAVFEKDILRTIYERLLENERPFPTEEAFWSYLRQACRFTKNGVLRKESAGMRKQPDGSRVSEETIPDNETPPRKASDQELVRLALDSMPDDLRTVYEMKKFNDMSREEIADAIGTSRREVQSLLERAYRHLRRYANAQSSYHPEQL